MTSFWWVAGGLLGFAAILLLWPLRWRAAGGTDADLDAELAIYRDQITELERELETGRIGKEEARGAKVEIERRMLTLADRAEKAQRSSTPLRLLLAAGALAAPALALFVYLDLGQPGRPDAPQAARAGVSGSGNAAGGAPGQVPGQAAGEMASRAEAMAARLERDGGNFEDWWLLGQSFSFLERYGEAAKAFKKASEINQDDPRVRGVYAETLVQASGGKVTAEAELAFRKVLEQRPEDPRARYYVGLSAAQNEQFADALQLWQALYRDSPADAPWLDTLRQGLIDMAGLLDIDPATVVPDPRPAELARAENLPQPSAANAAPEDLDALRARLEAEPKDYQGWLALARGEAGRGDMDAARAAIARVKEIFPGAPFVQQQIARVEGELAGGVDGSGAGGAGNGASGPRGPTAEQVQAAQEMTPEQQQEMIRGMVGGLAQRLDEKPDDLQGWLMLLRSYGVLGDRDAAKAAYERSVTHFQGNGDALAALEQQARVSGLIN